jgi:hypothetical protein
MPCRDWGDDKCSDIALIEAQTALAAAPKPSLLCEACSLLENAGLLGQASDELRQWYVKHEKKEEHKVRLEAAEKLSERERRLFGIDIVALRAKAK